MSNVSSPSTGAVVRSRRLRAAAFLLALGLLGGCRDMSDMTGSVGASNT